MVAEKGHGGALQLARLATAKYSIHPVHCISEFLSQLNDKYNTVYEEIFAVWKFRCTASKQDFRDYILADHRS